MALKFALQDNKMSEYLSKMIFLEENVHFHPPEVLEIGTFTN